jgi:predicted DNA-binding transcriptional regulator AlpA
MEKTQDQLLRIKDIIGVGGVFPVGRTAFYRLVKDGILPRPIKLGRVSAWRMSDIQKAISDLQPAARHALKHGESFNV